MARGREYPPQRDGARPSRPKTAKKLNQPWEWELMLFPSAKQLKNNVTASVPRVRPRVNSRRKEKGFASRNRKGRRCRSSRVSSMHFQLKRNRRTEKTNRSL